MRSDTLIAWPSSANVNARLISANGNTSETIFPNGYACRRLTRKSIARGSAQGSHTTTPRIVCAARTTVPGSSAEGSPGVMLPIQR